MNCCAGAPVIWVRGLCCWCGAGDATLVAVSDVHRTGRHLRQCMSYRAMGAVTTLIGRRRRRRRRLFLEDAMHAPVVVPLGVPAQHHQHGLTAIMDARVSARKHMVRVPSRPCIDRDSIVGDVLFAGVVLRACSSFPSVSSLLDALAFWAAVACLIVGRTVFAIGSQSLGPRIARSRVLRCWLELSRFRSAI